MGSVRKWQTSNSGWLRNLLRTDIPEYSALHDPAGESYLVCGRPQSEQFATGRYECGPHSRDKQEALRMAALSRYTTADLCAAHSNHPWCSHSPDRCWLPDSLFA